MKTNLILFLLAISSNLVGQVFQNAAQVQRLIVDQPNTLLLSAGMSNIQRIDIARLGYSDGNSYFNFELADSKSQLTITPLADIVVYDTISHEWVEWEKEVMAGGRYCEFHSDTMFVVRSTLETGEYEWAWSVRDVANPIKVVNKRQIDLVEKSSVLPFRLVITTESGSREQTFECVQLEEKPFLIFCGKNGGELNRNEVTSYSEFWVNFHLSEDDRKNFPYFKTRNPIRTNGFTISIVFEYGTVKEYRVNGNQLNPDILLAIQDPGAKKLFIDGVEYADNNSVRYSLGQGIAFTLK
jgi:hypothetical protein